MNATIIQSALCKTRVRHRPLPSIFFFPGLNTNPIFDNSQISIAKALAEKTSIIREEYLQLKSKRPVDSYDTGEHKLHQGKWEWHSFIDKGSISTEFQHECPVTTALLESFTAPRFMKHTPFSFAFFSTLRSQSSIQPHYGPANIRIRCHLPLIVPQGDCGFRVGSESIVSDSSKWFTHSNYCRVGKLESLSSLMTVSSTAV